MEFTLKELRAYIYTGVVKSGGYGVVAEGAVQAFDKLTKESEERLAALRQAQNANASLRNKIALIDMGALVPPVAKHIIDPWRHTFGPVGTYERCNADFLFGETTRPNVDPLPFDEERAKAGDAIEVQMASSWIVKQFIGTFISTSGVPMVTYLHNGKPDWAPRASVRMKRKEREVTLYANVRYGAMGYHGALYDNANTARANGRDATTSGRPVATAIPVKITVAE
jgi:hypothetical protein